MERRVEKINKHGGWKCAWRVEFFFKINKRDATFIREMRVRGLSCKVEKTNNIIIQPSIKDSFNYLGLLCRIEKTDFIIPLRKKNLHKYPGSSLQNFLKKCDKDHLKKPP